MNSTMVVSVCELVLLLAMMLMMLLLLVRRNKGLCRSHQETTAQ